MSLEVEKTSWRLEFLYAERNIDRLPWKATYRTLVLGLVIGTAMRGLRWGKGQLDEQVKVRAAEGEAGTGEGRRALDGETEAAIEGLHSAKQAK